VTEPEPLIHKEHAPLAAALLTALGGILTWMITAGLQLDGRLDRLEQAARVLISPDGAIVPAPESVQAKFHAEALEREVVALRQRLELLERELLERRL
jgi:hypothetical protein